MKNLLVTQNILNDHYHQSREIEELKQAFARQEVVRLPDLLQPQVFAALQAEVTRLEAMSVAKQYYSQGANTPRYMAGVGGCTILEQSALLSALYVHYELWQLLGQIVDSPMYRSTHEQEFMAVNYLLDVGHTQGWHLDDNAFTLIIIIDAPPAQLGGTVECIFDWHHHAEPLGWTDNQPVDSIVETLRQAGRVAEYSFVSGEAYLLHAARTMHRVTPLTEKARRAVIGIGYEETPNPVYSHLVTGLYDG